MWSSNRWGRMRSNYLRRREFITLLAGARAGSIGLAVAVGIAYFLAARLSLALLTQPGGVAVFWPASGVAAGTLIALGPGARLPVVVGAMVGTIVAGLLGDRIISWALSSSRCATRRKS